MKKFLLSFFHFAAFVSFVLGLSIASYGQWIGDNSVNNIIHNATGDDNLISSCADDNGNTLVVFQRDNRLYAQKINPVGQLVWGNVMQAKLLSDSTTEKIAVRAIYDSANGLYLAWSQVNSATDTSIYAQHIDGAGNRLFAGTGTKLTTNQNVNSGTPMLAVAADKGLFVGYTEYNPSTKRIRAKINKVTTTGTALWGSNGITVQSTKGFSTVIGVVSSNADVFVFYESSRNDGINGTDYWRFMPSIYGKSIDVNSDIYCQKIIGATGVEWQSTDIPICTNGLYQGVSYPPNWWQWQNAIPDGQGGAIMGFFDYRNAFNNPGTFDVYAQRISALGERLWGNESVALRVSETVFYPSIALQQIAHLPDGAGGAYIGWSLSPSYEGVLYVRHVLPAGVVTWNTRISRSTNIALAKDAVNGLIVIYDSASVPQSYKIKAQKISETGEMLWGGGVYVSTAKSRDGNFRKGLIVTPATSGNFNICWTDGRNAFNGRDIYMSQVNGSNGGLVSTPNAANSSAATGYWTDTNTWPGGMVPNEHTDVVVTHEIFVTADIVCKSLTVIPPGKIIVKPGVRVLVKQ